MNRITLSNGLDLILLPDKTKNRTTGTICINAGGLNNKFKYDGKEYTQVYGIAHFLEHYLLEKSMYGNITNYFSNEYISNNGITSSYTTRFYISTVHDFEENFIKLINVVNNPSFDNEQINDVKKPIISEINKALDRPNRELSRTIFESLYKNIEFDKTLGSVEDITNMTIDDIKLYHDAFYQPSNQLMVITGNIDEDRIIKVIEDEYNKFKKDYKEVEKLVEPEVDEVVSERNKYVDNDKDEFVHISIKTNISKLTPIERNRLDYYIHYLLNENFSEKSSLFEYTFKNNISHYSTSYGIDVLDKKHLIIYLSLTTPKLDEAEKLLLDKFDNLEYDEESFKLYINRTIIKVINKTEKVENIEGNLFANIDYYELYEYDDIDFVKTLSYDDMLDLLSRIDFSNKSIVRRVKE